MLIAARTQVALGSLLLLLNSSAAETSEIHILAPTTIRLVINALAPEFEHMTGYKLVVTYDVAPVVKRQVEGGAAFDLVIVTRPLMDDLTKQGRIVPETRFDVGRAGAGVAVQTGAAKPDIGSADALRLKPMGGGAVLTPAFTSEADLAVATQLRR